MRTAIVGGGAAGFFLAINLKEMCPQMEVDIMESGTRVLRKVEVSGGGRCNLTNTFQHVGTLQEAYPRGHRLMNRLLKHFGHRETWQWFEQRGVALTAQPDGCVFPRSQDSHTIIHLFLAEANRLGINIKTGIRIASLDALSDYDYVCIATGGQPKAGGLLWLGHDVEPPVPSLFSLGIADEGLCQLTGLVVENVRAMLPATKLRAQGALLITHWGLSGPCILRLSSYAARHLAEAGYHSQLLLNWVDADEDSTLQAVTAAAQQYARRCVAHQSPVSLLPQRLWSHLATKALGQRAEHQWGGLNAKEMRRLANVMVCDEYLISGRAPHHDEFVTCGGIALSAINPNTLESRTRPGLFFAGEVLDVDGITGGFNLQAAWTTAHTVARAIAESSQQASRNT
ncbi:MAG: aminoacetone oxidase family FAD-binding enzyme [Prevotella sp.]|nr:aminoacetone oxidase family FAD-binding enzyme [Prevotella sp.]